MHSDPLAKASSQPDVKQLCKEFAQCAPLTTSGYGVQWVDHIRFCTWPGQTADGRKRGSKQKEAFPWEGASDTKPMLADRIISENVGLLITSFWNAIVKPKSSTSEAGSYAVRLVDHFLNEVLYEDLVREVELAAQYREHYGWFVLNPTWEQRITLKRQTISLAEMAMYAATNAQSLGIDEGTLAAWHQMVMDPTQEEGAIDVLKLLWAHYAAQTIPPQLQDMVPPPADSNLRKGLRKLRQSGSAEIVFANLTKNGPSLTALRPYDEVWIPSDASEIQTSRVIFQREYLSAADLRARIRTHQYEPAWVDAVIAKAGQGATFWKLPEGQGGSLAAAMQGATISNEASMVPLGHGLCEVIHAFHRSVDDDDVPAIYMTTFSPLASRDDKGNDFYAKHELLDYPHGDYPFVGGCREYWCRRFTSSRGVPEIVHTSQNEIKALRDAMIDRTSITVIPPVNVYQTPLDTQYRFGPAVRNRVVPGKEPQFMQMPSGQGMNEAVTAMDRLGYEVDNYFGLMSEKVTPQRVQAVQARSVGAFLLTWSKAVQHLVSLAQAYMSDAEFSQITGAPEGWLDARRDKMGLLSAQLQYDVRELDSELAQKRIEAMNSVVLPSDVAGVINRTKWVEIQVRSINPTWSKELIVPGQQASEAMFKGVKDDLAQMFLGNEASYVENDPAASQKLQYAQQLVAANPNYQQAVAQGTRFAELLQKWTKNLTFSVQQQQNKQIGRIGVQPGDGANA